MRDEQDAAGRIETMDDFVERLRDWWRAYMGRLRKRNLLAWILLGLLAGTLVVVLENRYANKMDPIVGTLLDAVLSVVRAPLWAGGIVLLGYVAVLLTLAFWETRFPRSSVTSLKTLEAQLAKLKTEAGQWEWKVRYGSEMPMLPGPFDWGDPQQWTDAARAEVARLNPTILALEKVFSKIVAVRSWDPALNDGLGAKCMELFRVEIIGPFYRSFNSTQQPLLEDTRATLVTFYERYNILRQWLVELDPYLAIRLTSYVDYADWVAADARFFARLEEALSVTALATTREAIATIAKAHGYPVPMPTPLPPDPPSDPDNGADRS